MVATPYAIAKPAGYWLHLYPRARAQGSVDPVWRSAWTQSWLVAALWPLWMNALPGPGSTPEACVGAEAASLSAEAWAGPCAW